MTDNRITISRLVQRLGVKAGFYWTEIEYTRGGKDRNIIYPRLPSLLCHRYGKTWVYNKEEDDGLVWLDIASDGNALCGEYRDTGTRYGIGESLVKLPFPEAN